MLLLRQKGSNAFILNLPDKPDIAQIYLPQ